MVPSLKPMQRSARILTDASGAVAMGVEFVNRNQEISSVMANLVVLACVCLCRTRACCSPHRVTGTRSGLANSSGLVGQYLMSHPALQVFGLFDEPTQCHMGATGGQLLNQDGYAKTTHASRGAFGSYQWMIAQAVKPTDLLGIATSRPDLYGDKLHAFLKTGAQHFASMTAVVEDLPVRENRVSLSDRLDRFGTPLAQATHTTHPDSRQTLAGRRGGRPGGIQGGRRKRSVGESASGHAHHGWNHHGRQSEALRVQRLWPDPRHCQPGDCRPRPVPTSGGVNPTYTVLALAARSSEHLLKNWQSVTA